MKIVCAGEILFDLIRGEEHLGGAPLNFAVSAHRLGHEAILISAVGNDERGDQAVRQIEKLGLSTEFIRRIPHSTGIVTVTFALSGEPDYEVHRPAAYDFLEAPPLEADWVYYGTLVQTNPRARAEIAKLIARIPNRFYDVNLRKDSYSPELTRDLLRQATAIKMNAEEAAILGFQFPPLPSVAAHARFVAITNGADGCEVMIDGERAQAAGIPVDVADRVGAGDAFAAAFLHGIVQGWSAKEVALYANRAGALVASRPGAIPDWKREDLDYQSARIPS